MRNNRTIKDIFTTFVIEFAWTLGAVLMFLAVQVAKLALLLIPTAVLTIWCLCLDGDCRVLVGLLSTVVGFVLWIADITLIDVIASLNESDDDDDDAKNTEKA